MTMGGKPEPRNFMKFFLNKKRIYDSFVILSCLENMVF